MTEVPDEICNKFWLAQENAMMEGRNLVLLVVLLWLPVVSQQLPR